MQILPSTLSTNEPPAEESSAETFPAIPDPSAGIPSSSIVEANAPPSNPSPTVGTTGNPASATHDDEESSEDAPFASAPPPHPFLPDPPEANLTAKDKYTIAHQQWLDAGTSALRRGLLNPKGFDLAYHLDFSNAPDSGTARRDLLIDTYLDLATDGKALHASPIELKLMRDDIARDRFGGLGVGDPGRLPTKSNGKPGTAPFSSPSPMQPPSKLFKKP